MSEYLNNIPKLKRQRKAWTKEDDAILSERFHHDKLETIARDLRCSIWTVNYHARKLGLYKENRCNRNEEVRAMLLDDYSTLSYSEIAKKTGMRKNSVWKIAQELGLRHTYEQKCAKIRNGMNKAYKKERRRILFGLDQETGWKIGCNKARNNLRCKLKKEGYIVDEYDINILYYTDDIIRHPKRERNGEALGLRIMPLPDESAEETDSSSASLAASDDEHAMPNESVEETEPSSASLAAFGIGEDNNQ